MKSGQGLVTGTINVEQFYLSRAREFVRFSAMQRADHLLMIICFTGLVVTGLPQKFHESAIATGMISAMGGIEMVRNIHHTLATLMIVQSVLHTLRALWGFILRRDGIAMLPSLKDLSETVGFMKYLVGKQHEEPKFDRYDFRHKFEYWALVWGTFVMILTGFVLWFPTKATVLIPGELVPAAKAAHGGEALLAALTIAVWHMYAAHFNPRVFPFDSSIFTGKISKERMIEEHPMEYARITGELPESMTETQEPVTSHQTR